jgi:phage terminase large subunit GpA-like protein
MSGDDKTEPPHELQRVMIRCPESGEAVPTGVRIDPASFEAGNRRKWTFVCPHCFREHTWSLDDAWTEASAC